MAKKYQAIIERGYITLKTRLSKRKNKRNTVAAIEGEYIESHSSASKTSPFDEVGKNIAAALFGTSSTEYQLLSF